MGFLNGSGSWWDEAAELGVLLVAGGILWLVARLTRRGRDDNEDDPESAEEEHDAAP
jgi:hypothetical protein